MAATALLVFVPQLATYRALNGTFGPSPLVKRKLTWWSPHFFEVLFDPAHGLYVWAPLLLVATAGLVWFARRDRRFALLGLGLFAQVAVNGAVESWTQAGAFGSRRCWRRASGATALDWPARRSRYSCGGMCRSCFSSASS
jgi:hypothetical protein